MRVKTLTALVLLLFGVSAGWNGRCARSHAASVSPDGSANFPVEFTDCVESIGVTLVSTARARAYVPAQFILVGEGQPVTPLVVRTASCRGISVTEHPPKAGEIVQVGLVIVPPDGTGDINNYTLWYYTGDAELATQLRRAGVSVQHVPTIDYDYDANDNSLFVRVPRPGSPRLALFGTVQPSPDPAGSVHSTARDLADLTSRLLRDHPMSRPLLGGQTFVYNGRLFPRQLVAAVGSRQHEDEHQRARHQHRRGRPHADDQPERPARSTHRRRLDGLSLASTVQHFHRRAHGSQRRFALKETVAARSLQLRKEMN